MSYTLMPLRQVREPFDDPDWIFELKYDGWRALAYIEPRCVTFVSRTGYVYGRRFDALGAALRRELRVRSAVLDGELVCLDSAGRPCFMDLMRRRGQPVFVAFDVLTHGKRDLRAWPLWRRKQRLRALVPARATAVLYAESIQGQGIALYAEACAKDLEGIVAKRRDSPYDPAQPWLKIKNSDYSQKVGRADLFDRKTRTVLKASLAIPT
ncbi:MAG: RNA ligase family protein [Candidatus Binatia bacterium]